MEFYKQYIDKHTYWAETRTTSVTTADELLNEDVKRNPQWKSEVEGYTIYNDCACILVRWVGLSTTPFKGDKL